MVRSDCTSYFKSRSLRRQSHRLPSRTREAGYLPRHFITCHLLEDVGFINRRQLRVGLITLRASFMFHVGAACGNKLHSIGPTFAEGKTTMRIRTSECDGVRDTAPLRTRIL